MVLYVMGLYSIFETFNGENANDVLNYLFDYFLNNDCNDVSTIKRVLNIFDFGIHIMINASVEYVLWKTIKSRILRSYDQFYSLAEYTTLKIMKRNGCTTDMIIDALNEIHFTYYQLTNYCKGCAIYICKRKCMKTYINKHNPTKCAWCKNDIIETIELV